MGRVVLKKKENAVVKVDGNKITVSPIINFMRQTELTNLCVRQCETFGENVCSAIPACKALFDICVLALQTDLPIDGVSENLTNDNYEINVTLSYDDIEEYIVSGIIETVKEKILNYDKVWAMVLQSIEMFNVKQCISFIGSNLPTVDEMKEQLTNMKNIISENKAFVDKAVGVKTASEIYAESVKAELKQKENYEKAKKGTAKKKK